MIRQGNRVLVPAGRPSARLARDAATDAARRAVAQQQTRQHHPDFTQTRGWKAIQAEKLLPKDGLNAEIARGLELGLPGASSIEDRTIPTFSRGELPHFAGINTFMKAPYLEDASLVGNYDATVMGVPFDGGTTYRPGTRFGPQGIRKISALYTPYNFEMGVDLREQMTLCDVGDVFTIPANVKRASNPHHNVICRDG